jgi:hypothetical protein
MTIFGEPNTDDFQLSRKKFYLPKQTLHLDAKHKREITICNLFANQNLSVKDIMRVLDESYENVIRSLIKHELLIDRRQRNERPLAGFDRRRDSAERRH